MPSRIAVLFLAVVCSLMDRDAMSPRSVTRATESGPQGRVSGRSPIGAILPVGALACLGEFPPQSKKIWVFAVAYSPDGKVIATSGNFGIACWESQTGKLLRQWEPPGKDTRLIRFTRSGTLLSFSAPANIDMELCAWETGTGKELRRHRLPNAYHEGLAISLDGRRVATRRIREYIVTDVWDAMTGRRLREFPGRHHARSLAFSDDGRFLAQGRDSGVLDLGETATGRLRYTSPVESGWIPAVRFSPAGDLVAAWEGQGDLVLREVPSGKERRRISMPRKIVRGIDFSPDGRLVAASGNGGTVEVWEVLTGRMIRHFEGHVDDVNSVAFSPDGRRLVSGSSDGTALVWDVIGRAAVHSAAECTSAWKDMASPETSRAVTAAAVLSNGGPAAVACLRARLHAERPVPATELTRALADLDSANPIARERATRRLREWGGRVETELRRAVTKGLALEARRRVERVLAEFANGPTDPKQLRLLRAVRVLERIGTTEARDVLRSLATGAEDAPLTREARAALQRLSAVGTRP